MTKQTIVTYVLVLLLALLFQNCTEDSNSIIDATSSIQNAETAIDYSLAEEDEEITPISEISTARSRSGYFRFRTLNAALHCTELNVALFNGTKTIYAPSDAAFAKLGLNEHNVCDLDIDVLTSILLYHVVDRKVNTRERGCLEMLDGNITHLAVNNHRLFINDSQIYRAFNQRGRHYKLRVYVITDVLTVPEATIVETASSVDMFSILVDAVLAADPMIAQTLSNPDNILTVFAPTNDAFVNLLGTLNVGSLEELIEAIGVEGLSTVLRYHVVPACAFSNDLKDGLEITTAQGEALIVDLDNLAIIDKTGEPSNLLLENLDILTSNGVVHSIDKVLLPDAILMAL